MAGKIRMGEVLRYGRPYRATSAKIDGLGNFFYRVHSKGLTLPTLERGISSIGLSSKSEPIPAVLISSSPHKVGSDKTPWQDFFRPDYGHIRYFGDNRRPGCDPSLAKGNSILLKAFEKHASPDSELRKLAPPMLFFRRVRIGERVKGNVQFNGYGIIERVERVVQIDPRTRQSFANYVFDFAVFSLAEENEEFDWNWIDARRNPKLSHPKAPSMAPKAWQRWVANGASSIEQCRRRTSKLMVIAPADRKPIPRSKEAKLLDEIYRYYTGRKSRFEALAAYVAGKIFAASGDNYFLGWITPSSGDGGADFVGRLDLGCEMARVKLVVLGQAKCERPDAPTGGNHIARTVARLRRGWLGVYVTTSYFSEAVQREVIEDQYPIMLIDGQQLADEVAKVMNDRGQSDTTAFLDEIDKTYGASVARRSPDEILLL